MTGGCRALFDYALGFVTSADLAAYAPSDPGYHEYVAEFAAVLRSRTPPAAATFSVTETVGLTWWADADRERDPPRFRRFRTLTNAAGMAVRVAGGRGDDLPANFFAISLIDDTDALGDRDLLALLPPAFDELHARLVADLDGEEAFLTLATLLVGFMRGEPAADPAMVVERLIDEESRCHGWASPEFLWGCTHFDLLHRRWKDAVRRFLPPDGEHLALLREELLRDRRRPS